MAELEHYGIDIDVLRRMYREWLGGAKKSDLERRYLDKPESHGKLFTNLVREHLGIETERRSTMGTERDALAREVARLTELLRAHGINPNEGTAVENEHGTKETN
ncbi:MAG: hypothetical protein AB7V43_14615 [Acidimicrobiia bacterium]